MPDDVSASWRSTMRRRLVVGAIALLAWSAAIQARLVYLQVIRHEKYVARAKDQQEQTLEIPGERGELVDRNGRSLAYSVQADSIYAVPTEAGDPAEAAAALCGALDDCAASERRAIAERIRQRRYFAWVKRQASPDEARRVAALKLSGVGLQKESRRFYPNKSLAAHALGYVGVDNQGLNGIEAAYDVLIRGRSGAVLIQTDARRQTFSRIERPPMSGATLELTLDLNLQYLVERELRVGVRENRAAGGTAVVMDPRTGEILALANWPTFNPNVFRESDEHERRNFGIQNLYEPGSTFKLVTASAALEEHAVRPDELIDVSAGLIRFGNRVIRDDHPNGVLTFEDVIVKSSNVGAIKVGMRLGAERLGAYVNRFGFGRRSSPDFPAENPGITWDPAKLTPSALASVSMGYQVAVTPLQMAAAVSSIANRGELIQPRLVRAVIADGRRTPVPHKVVRRTVSTGTAAVLTEMMEQVVERGTARSAQIEGFTVAGKTGTAQKVVDRRYSNSEYYASFVGFVPSRNPVFAIVVVIDSPHGNNSYYGGTVAAPVFQRIAAAGLRLYGVPPSINPAPPVMPKRNDEPKELLVKNPASPVADRPRSASNAGSVPMFPDLGGLSAREALQVLAKLGVNARIKGAGVVVDQDPLPGSPIERGTVSVLTLAREAPVEATARAMAGP